MWLQAFEALGPQVYTNIPLCVEQSHGCPLIAGWDELSLQDVQASKKWSHVFCITPPNADRPSWEWVMCGAGRSHGHRRCLCDLSWPCRKRVNRLDGKAWHLWDFETFQSSAWELFQVGIFTPALQGCTSSVPLWSASSSSQMFEYQKVPSLWQVRPRVRGCITAQQYTSPSTEGLVVWKALFLLFH